MKKLTFNLLSENFSILSSDEMSEFKGGQNSYNNWSDIIDAVNSGTSGAGVWYNSDDDNWMHVDELGAIVSSTGFTSYGSSTYGWETLIEGTEYDDTWSPGAFDDYGDYGDYGDGSGGEYGSYGYGEGAYTGFLAGFQDPKPDTATKHVRRYAKKFYENKTSGATLEVGMLPNSNWSVNPDGTYKNPDGETVYGITYLDASGKTVVSLSPHMMAKFDDYERGGVMVHELIHAKHLKNPVYKELYVSDRAQFNKNSEYAAYKAQAAWENSYGTQSSKQTCLTKMSQLQAAGADTTWDSSL